mgnify:FL=1
MDARRARDRLNELHDAGRSWGELSRMSGVSPRIVREVARGARTRIKKSTQDRIMGASGEAKASHQVVDGTWYYEQIDSLMANGFNASQIMRVAGLSAAARRTMTHREERPTDSDGRYRVRNDAVEALRASMPEFARLLSMGEARDVELAEVRDAARVPAAWLRRQLLRLVSHGVPLSHVSRACGIDRNVLGDVRSGKKGRVALSTVRKFESHRLELEAIALSDMPNEARARLCARSRETLVVPGNWVRERVAWWLDQGISLG